MNMNPQNLKTILYPGNFFEMPDNVLETNSLKVIDYKFRCYRERDEFNNPYGSFMTEDVIFTVKASSLNDCKPFYQFMDEHNSHPFSIIFDPKFNAYQRMTNYKDGIVVNGYVVDVLESCENSDVTGDEQLEIKIILSLNKISYLGMENLHELDNSSELIYKLSFHENIVDPGKEMPELTIIQRKKTSLTRNGETFDIDLNKLSFERKIYQPGCIVANIQICFQSNNVTESSSFFSQDDLKELLLQRRVTLTGMSAADPNTLTNIAENYYVHEIVPQMVRDSKKNMLFVKLNIFSMDKIMTLNPYSKAYVTKRLGADVLKSESKLFGFNSQLIKVNTDNMQSLVYQDTSQPGATNEFIQPYLVQYNESFYDFMVRVANRCGEFLMFEDGQLFLGLPKKTEPMLIKDYASVSYQNMSTTPLSIKAFTRDSVKSEKKGELNNSPVEKDKTGYPVGTFGTDYTYNSELAHDDYIFPMFKDGFSNFGRVIGMYDAKSAIRKISLDIFSQIVSNSDDAWEGPKGIAKSTVFKYGIDLAFAKYNAAQANAGGNKAWVDAYKDKPQQYDGNSAVQFGTVLKEGWLKLAYYSQIRKDEEAQQKKIIHVDMGVNVIPVKLGDLVTIDKIPGKYIVIRIQQQSNISKNTGTAPGSNANKLLQSQQIDVIPVIEAGENGKDHALPPVIEEPIVRKSGPQTAFIVENCDPKNQGRVRIAFPWQAVGDPILQHDLQEAKDDLEKKTEITKQAEAKQEQLQQKLEIQKGQNRTLARIQGSLVWDTDVKKQKELFEKKHEENKAKLEAITKRINKINDNLTDDTNPDSLASKLAAAAKDPDQKEKEESLLKEKVQQEEECQKLKAEKEVLEGAEDDLKAYSSSSDSPMEFLKKRQENRTENSIETTKSLLKDAEKEVGAAKKVQKESQAVVDKLTKKWGTMLSEVASPWVRVATPMATQEGGVYFKPRPGDEVMVNFDCDNIERPYVTGSLYSKEHVRPDESMVIKSPSGQRISFDIAEKDDKFVQTLTPMLSKLGTYIPGLGKNLTFGKDARKLCGGINITDEFGMFSVSMSSNKRSVNISSPFGTVGINAFTGISINAPNGDINIKGKNVSIEAGNNLRLISGTNVTNENSAPEPDNDNHGADAGDGFKHPDPSFLGKLGGWAKTGASAVGGAIVDGVKEGAGKALDFGKGKAREFTGSLQVVDMYLLRCLGDVFLRPIEGTLLVKSRNYLMLEAGKGRAEVPVEKYSKAWQDRLVVEKDPLKQLFYAKTSAYVSRINEKVGNFCNDYAKLREEALKSQNSYNTYLKTVWKKGEEDKPKVKEEGFKAASGAFKYNDEKGKGGTITIDGFHLKNLKGQENGRQPLKGLNGEKLVTIKDVELYMKPAMDHYGHAVWALHKHVLDFKNLINDDTIKAVNDATLGKKDNESTKWIDNAFKKAVFAAGKSYLESIVNNWHNNFGDTSKGPGALFLDPKCPDGFDAFRNPKHLKRWIVALFLLELYKSEENRFEPKLGVAQGKPGKFFTICYSEVTIDLVDKEWADVARLAPKMGLTMKFMKKLVAIVDDAVGVTKAYKQIFNTDKPKLGWDRRVWDGKGGKIIFSDEKNVTYRVEKDKIEKWVHADVGNEGMLKNAIINTK